MPPRQRTPDGPPPAPAVQRFRIRYAKRGRLRFTSTRDFQRALERALRRAAVPVAFSAGFHPHPKISYANAAPTGVASEAEYFELSVTTRLDCEALRGALDAALPQDLDVITVIEAPPGSLADRLEASEWAFEFADVDAAALDDAVAQFLACEDVTTTRMTKTGPRTIDIRGPVVRAAVRVDDTACAILRMVVRHTTPAVRPDDILTALRTVAGLQPPRPPLVVRLAQGPLDAASGLVADPLETGEDAGTDADGIRDDAALQREPDRL